MTVQPTIVYKSVDGEDVLSIWPAIPGASGPVIQIDHGARRHAVVEFQAEDAPALAMAILEAAARSQPEK